MVMFRCRARLLLSNRTAPIPFISKVCDFFLIASVSSPDSHSKLLIPSLQCEFYQVLKRKAAEKSKSLIQIDINFMLLSKTKYDMY